MRQRGRKSAVGLTVPIVDGSPIKLEPSPDLSPTERRIFIDIVSVVDRRHFRPSDQPILCAYVRAVGYERAAAAELAVKPNDTKLLAAWERATRALTALAMRVRLCPQARQHAKSAGRLPAATPTPWSD